ncbi:NACHT nucleoside triphosphatase [Penicillium sp. CMV-2018d]|nr:NACHT nucleoside triphosphatase [Penicillium sp. CMV-2018d]
MYWVDHLQASKCDATYRLSLDDRDRVDTFLQQKYLHWLEALRILGRLPHGIQAMQRREVLIEEENKSEALLHRARDASRIGIESSPFQVYCSSLIFSPLNSLTRVSFQKERAHWVLNHPAVEENWNLCLYTLEGNGGGACSISWSLDGSRLASASDDKTVKV